jgi:hypothetical protein
MRTSFRTFLTLMHFLAELLSHLWVFATKFSQLRKVSELNLTSIHSALPYVCVSRAAVMHMWLLVQFLTHTHNLCHLHEMHLSPHIHESTNPNGHKRFPNY